MHNHYYNAEDLGKFGKIGENKKDLADKLGIPVDMSFTTYVNGLFFKSEPSKII